MGKMIHGQDGNIDRRFDLLEEHEVLEICGKDMSQSEQKGIKNFVRR